MNPFPMVLADLRALRGTGLVTTLLIGLAVAIGIAVGAQERALRQSSARAAADFPLVIGAPSSQTQLILTSVYLQLEALPLVPGTTLRDLAADQHVAGAAPLAYGDVALGYPIVGTTLDFVTRWGRIAPVEGRVFEREGEVVIGADVKLPIGGEIAPSHGASDAQPGREGEGEHAHRHAARYVVVGRLPRVNAPWDRAILAPVESVWETHGLGDGHSGAEGQIGPPFVDPPGVPVIVVKPRTVADAYRLRAQYRQGGTMAVFPAEVLTSLYGAIGDLRDLVVAIAALNNVVVLLAVTLLLVTLAGARRKRYAMLRAMGASRTYIALVVWLTGSALVAAGCILGLGLGWAGSVAVSTLLQARTGLALSPRPGSDEIALCATIFGVGAALSLIAALMTARLRTWETLRS